jgi:hypothetical protein
VNLWSESRDQEGCLKGLTRGSLFIPSAQVLTGLTGVVHRSDRCDPYWVLTRVNVLVSWFFSGLALVSSLVLVGAWCCEFLNLGFSSKGRPDRCAIPV